MVEVILSVILNQLKLAHPQSSPPKILLVFYVLCERVKRREANVVWHDHFSPLSD